MTFLDPAALMRIRSLELRARVVVEGLWRGLHRSPYHGFSVEFTEYRPYVKGDDPRHVDWKVAARTDRHYIKKYEDETNLRCQFLLDHSRSMQFGSMAGLRKSDYAATLVATLSYFLMQQGDAAGLSTFGQHLDEHIPPRNRPGHLRRLLVELEKPSAHATTALATSLASITDLLRKRGLVMLVSDLIAPVEHLESQLGLLAARGHDVVLFHIMDRAEVDFTFTEAAQFRSLEGGSQLFVDPAAARAGYLERHGAHLKKIRDVCNRHGIRYQAAITDVPLEKLLLDYLKETSGKSGLRVN
ncbi:MAG: DUF58 domain-containing protein [Verrucomicrobiaceae bacterium]|nr:DUF58 domain-containing protein [Verrucomicrobiaceae bacterium]